jgi:hypothetical protein
LARPHELIEQRFGATHCESAVQSTKHLLPLHPKGLHGSEAGVTQRPAPSHVEAGVYTFEVQVSAAQVVVFA